MQSIFYPFSEPWPYESVYSILTKVSRANYLALPNLRRVLVSAGAFGVARKWYDEVPGKNLRVQIAELNEFLPWAYAPDSGLIAPQVGLQFCSLCIKFGYHSVFNLIVHHKICPMHKRPLSEACENCRESYLKGFSLEDDVSGAAEPCQTCGFYEIPLAQEIAMRRSRSLVLGVQGFGVAQAEWYKQIKEVCDKGSLYGLNYFESESAREDLTGPFENVLRVKSPESLSGVSNFSGSGSMFWVKLANVSTRHVWETHALSAEMVGRACKEIELLFLSGHLDCLSDINRVAGYADGSDKCASLCTITLAYAILRFKLGYHDWPVPGGLSPQASGFDHAWQAKPASSYISVSRDVRITFLIILGNLQLKMSELQSFYVICRSSTHESIPNYKSLVFIRKSTFGFRNMCSYSNSIWQVSRAGHGGPLLVSRRVDENQALGSSPIREFIF